MSSSAHAVRKNHAPDLIIHATLDARADDSQVLINYISGGQGGNGGGGGVHGGSGGTGHGPSFHYDITAENVTMVNHMHASPVVVHASQVLNHCPPPSRNFQGRQRILESMHQFFSKDTGKQHIYVLYGLGGAGKTQIALKFIDSSTSFTDWLLLDASSAETIKTALKNVATAKQFGKSWKDGVRWLLTQKELWLLFFDNADDPHIDLNKFFPECNHGNIIVTSRNPDLRSYGGHSEVSDMEESDAVLLLLQCAAQRPSPINNVLAGKIVKELCCLPLAIVQAGAFILRSKSLNTYLDLYRANRAELLSEKPSQSHAKYAWTVYTTWKMSFERLSPPAAMFLKLCSFIHWDGILEETFSRAAHHLLQNGEISQPKKLQKLRAKVRRVWSRSQSSSKNKAESAREFLSHFLGPTGKWDSVCFLKITHEIIAYSLINFDAERKSFSIHPLVHNWSRTTFSDQDSFHSCMGEILGMCIMAIPNEDMGLASLRLVSHVDSLVQHISTKVGRFGPQYAIIYHHAGRLTAAKELEESLFVLTIWTHCGL
ncbi:P-loop containing nucleoside triphosphate hydrolase protein, partial [Mycena galopus ATCC 62051]